MNLPEFSVKRSVTVTMFIMIIVVLGFISLTRLGLDMLPDITFPVMAVITSYEGVAPGEIENVVTKPLEEIVTTVKNVKNVSSFSQEGISAIIVEFEWGTNLDAAAQDIRDKIDMFKDFLPEDISNPLISQMDPSMMPVVVYGITGGENRDMFSLKKWIEDDFKSQMEQVDGVASVMVAGGLTREINVRVDRKKLESYNVGMTQVIMALGMSNTNTPAGHIEKGYNEYLLRTLGEYKNVEEIENTAVTQKNGVPILVKDIAKVEDTHAEIRDYARTNGRESCVLVLNKESGANTVKVSRRANKALKRIEANKPQDINIYPVFDQARMITKILAATGQNGLWGGFLAIVIIYLFLKNWRPTFTIFLAIPLSLLCIFIPLYFLGYTLNFITLIGLALGVGMLVDNSIVVIENVYRHLEAGQGRMHAAIAGATEVASAITASTMTTIAVFVPLIFATGITGRIFRDLAFTIAFSLIGSLVVALTIVPMVASKLFRKRTGDEHRTDFLGKLLNRMQESYRGTISWVLVHPKRMYIYAVLFMVGSFALLPFVGKEFFPKTDSHMAMAQVKMPIGTNLEETNRVVKQVENIITSEEGVEVLSVFLGLSEEQKQDAAWGSGAAGVNEAQVMIKLMAKKDRKRGSEEIINSIRRRMPVIEGAKFDFYDMGGMMMMGSQQKPINIKIFGKDLDMLEKISDELLAKIKNVKGIFDADTTLVKARPEMKIEILRDKAAKLGLSMREIGGAIQTAMQGRIATRLRREGDEINVRVRLREQDRQTVEDLEDVIITSQFGTQTRLKDVARIYYGLGPIKLDRENQKRKVAIEANISGRDLGSITSEIKKIVDGTRLPEGYFVEFGGESEQLKDMFVDLSMIFALAVLLVYMVMAAQFESFTHPLVIIFSVPFSIVGVILALVFTGKNISLPMGMGLILLSGIIVNNGIVFIDYVNQLRSQGMEKLQALAEAGAVRLRPILMTALTTALGMFPLAISRAEGANIRSAVAITIIGGLAIGTALTLVLMPLVYNTFDGIALKVKEKYLSRI